jgi:Spy/CpxP family protein refolding chaperone
MRLAILIIAAVAAFATTPARALGTAPQGAWLETRMMRAICSSKAAPANPDRLARRLNLTDPQKAALKDLIDASASADASSKKSLCADKMDVSTVPGRVAFDQKITENRLASLKAVQPKLQAFYASLDPKQKKAFDTGGRVGGLFDWWGTK